MYIPMNKNLVIFYLLSSISIFSFGQSDLNVCDQLQLTDKIKCQFEVEYNKFSKDAFNYLKGNEKSSQMDFQNLIYQLTSRKSINSLGIPLMNKLFEMEKLTFYSKNISANSRELITWMRDPYLVVLLERAIKEDETETNYFFKEKILVEVSNYLNLLMSKKYPYYNYETKNKKAVKFIGIRTGNDLFTSLKGFPQKNLDRDYTGSLLLEIGTDYLNSLRKRPLKTYQTFFYGFDVFTPSFYDTFKFKNFNDFDTLDRPHASFQYFGWSKKGLSKHDRIRWSTTIKLGKIGGKIGNQFQTVLHQDVSYSLRPKGWDAQISNKGRLGFSLETKHEWQFRESKGRANRFTNINLSFFNESKVGTYMTNTTFGFQISNKSYSQTNHNFINQRTKQGVINRMDHIMYNISLNYTHVVHNTMLEGYGWFRTNENKNDKFTPTSIYTLDKSMINKNLLTINIRLAYTTRYATIFYNWFGFSPETKLGKLNSSDSRLEGVDLSKRLHHFAEIGMSFNVH